MNMKNKYKHNTKERMINKMYNRDNNGWYNSAVATTLIATEGEESKVLKNANEKKYCHSCLDTTLHSADECSTCSEKSNNKYYNSGTTTSWWSANSCWLYNNTGEEE